MVEIEKIKDEIVEKLKPLNPDKVILFGSYAYGTPNEESDIDLFIMKDLKVQEVRKYKQKARESIRDLIAKYKIGFDFLVASEDFVKKRKDYFYQVDILQNGKVIYE